MMCKTANTIDQFKKGQPVRYDPGYSEPKYGVVSSVNEQWVFVKYNNLMCVMITGDEPYTARATSPTDLVLL